VTDNIAPVADWVTVIFLVATPAPDTVTVAFRAVVCGLAATVRMIMPFPFPEAGLTVSHGWSDSAVQAIFEVTERVSALPAVDSRVAVAGVTDNIAPAADWVIVIFWVITPVPDTVTVAFRAVVCGLAAAVRMIVPFPFPEAGLTVNHSWSD
jgi:hypothetical protein